MPRAEGRAALRRAAEEARLRSTKLIVINSNRGGGDLDDEDAVEHERELAEVRAQLDAEGIEHEVRQLVRGPRPGRGPDRRRRGDRGRLHRDRAAPAHPGRQADPRQQRPAHPARGALPGARRQGRGVGSVAAGDPAADRHHRRRRRPTRCSTATRSRCSPACCSTSSSRWSAPSPGRRRSPSGSASTSSTRQRSPRSTRRRSRACARRRRRCTATPAAWRRGSRRSPGRGRRVRRRRRRAVDRRRTPAPSCSRRLKALPGFGDAKARIFLALLGKQLGVQPAGLGGRPPGTTPRRARTARWPTWSTRPAWPRSARSSRQQKQAAESTLTAA